MSNLEIKNRKNYAVLRGTLHNIHITVIKSEPKAGTTTRGGKEITSKGIIGRKTFTDLICLNAKM